MKNFFASPVLALVIMAAAGCSPQPPATATPPARTATGPLDPWLDLILGRGTTAPISTSPFTAKWKAEKDGAKCETSFEARGVGRTEEYKVAVGSCARVVGVEPPAEVEIGVSVQITGTINGTIEVQPIESPESPPMPPPDLLNISIEFEEFRYVVLAYRGEKILTFRKITKYGNVYAKDLYTNDSIERFSGIWLLGENYNTLRVSYNHDATGAATFREWRLEEIFP